MATSGYFYMATNGDFLMAMDKGPQPLPNRRISGLNNRRKHPRDSLESLTQLENPQ